VSAGTLRVSLTSVQGFKDLLLIGNQSRRHIFDLVIARPELLYEDVIEVDERVILVKKDEGHGGDAADTTHYEGTAATTVVSCMHLYHFVDMTVSISSPAYVLPHCV
jgi:N-methylhydantoinase A/oxoprolinase/acetone carboxylase beta subunit